MNQNDDGCLISLPALFVITAATGMLMINHPNVVMVIPLVIILIGVLMAIIIHQNTYRSKRRA
jgi:hypothetical protein